MEELFSKLGFSAGETKVYLALAETGKASATVVAKRTRLPRSTAYSLLNSLISRGLVSSEKDSEVTFYVPNPPSTFSLIMKAEAEEQAKLVQERIEVATELESVIGPYFKQKNFSIPKILFFEGRKNVEAMHYTYEKEWQEQVSHFDYTWWGYQDTDYVEKYREWLDHYWKGLKPEEKIWLLSNKSSPVEKKLKGKVDRRIIKQIPNGIQFSSTIWVLGDYVVLLMTRHEPNYAILMRDAVFAANQRQIFQLLWQLIK